METETKRFIFSVWSCYVCTLWECFFSST